MITIIIIFNNNNFYFLSAKLFAWALAEVRKNGTVYKAAL